MLFVKWKILRKLKTDLKENHTELCSNMPKIDKSGSCLRITSEFYVKIIINSEFFNPFISTIKKHLDYLKFIDNRYLIIENNFTCYSVFDKLTRNQIQLTIEPKICSVILYPISRCKSKTIMDLVKMILKLNQSQWVEIIVKKYEES